MLCTSVFASSAVATSKAAIKRSAREIACIVIGAPDPAILSDSRGLTLEQALERKIEGFVGTRGELLQERPQGFAALCARTHFAIQHELAVDLGYEEPLGVADQSVMPARGLGHPATRNHSLKV